MKHIAPVLEVIACSVADAVEAEKGGASRLEVISHFELGGLTPPLDLVRDILAAVHLPVRVMLRESEPYATTDQAEIERLCLAARALSALPIDGLVLGFLRDGEIDDALTARLLSCAPKVRVTFHHAFEATKDPWRTIKRLKKHDQIDRILSAGGAGSWPQKIARLASYEREARPEITILAGGGMDREAISSLCEATNIREFHLGRAARFPQDVTGTVCASQVRELVHLIADRGKHG